MNDGSEDFLARAPPRVAFRLLVGVAAAFSGLVLLLWASDQGELWKFFPALFCFAVLGFVTLPRRLAIACGYVVSLTVLWLSTWYVYLGFTGKAELMDAVRFAAFYGGAALGFLVYRQIPWRS